MSDAHEPQPEALSLEEVVRASHELATRSDASQVAAGFLELVQRWAQPSAVLTAVKDATAAAGWRLQPSLCAGSLTLGIEKTLARLVEDSPECLARPTVLRGEEVPGIRVRDNVVVPWWCEDDAGLLVLRGVPRPARPGLGEALALAGTAVWPRLLGSPAARIEVVLRELQGGATRLDAAVARQLERLQAAAPQPGAAPDVALTARMAELEGELEALRGERDALARQLAGARRDLESAHDDLGTAGRALEGARRDRETAGLDLAAARQQSDNARRELAAAREERRSVERELETVRRELAAVKRGDGAVAGEPGTSGAPAQSEPAVSERAGAALKLAVAAARRAAFVPPLLRVSMEDVATIASPGPRPARRLGLALLDRDVVALEPVAAELEAGGIEVRLAQQPEELALLLRSPDASAIDAIVCDVMSFRPDQNVAGLLRGWDKDRPGLASYLSYDAQSPIELERARRTPMSLTAGHIQRPLTSARLGETLENLAKRLGKTS